MGTLDGGNDPFGAREFKEGVDGLGIACGDVVDPLDIFQKAVLRADAGVVQATCHRVDGQRLALIVLKEIGLEAVQGTGLAKGQGGGVLAIFKPHTGRLHTVNVNPFVLKESGEKAHGVGPTAHAGHDVLGEPAVFLFKLGTGFKADDLLEVPNHHGKGVGTHHRTDGVELGYRVCKVGFKGGVHGVFKGLGATGYRHHVSA